MCNLKKNNVILCVSISIRKINYIDLRKSENYIFSILDCTMYSIKFLQNMYETNAMKSIYRIIVESILIFVAVYKVMAVFRNAYMRIFIYSSCSLYCKKCVFYGMHPI